MIRAAQWIVLLTLLAAARMIVAAPSGGNGNESEDKFGLDFDTIGISVDDRWMPHVTLDFADDMTTAPTLAAAQTQAPLSDAARPQIPVPSAVWAGLILFVAVLFISRSHTFARW